MKAVSVLNAAPKQQVTLLLGDGSQVVTTFEFRGNQRGWFCSLDHQASGFSDNNRRLVAGPNILRAFRNVIPFGITCRTADGQDPWFLNDFVSGRVQVYVLEKADLAPAEAVILG